MHVRHTRDEITTAQIFLVKHDQSHASEAIVLERSESSISHTRPLEQGMNMIVNVQLSETQGLSARVPLIIRGLNLVGQANLLVGLSLVQAFLVGSIRLYVDEPDKPFQCHRRG